MEEGFVAHFWQSIVANDKLDPADEHLLGTAVCVNRPWRLYLCRDVSYLFCLYTSIGSQR